MKRALLMLLTTCFFFGCRKAQDASGSPAAEVRTILQDQLSAADFQSVDFSTLQQARLSNGHQLYLIRMGKDQIVLDLDADHRFVKGNIFCVSGDIISADGHASFNGVFERSTLQRSDAVSYLIEKGVVSALHQFNDIITNSNRGQRIQSTCSDCTLPEVMVSSSPSAEGSNWASWLSLLAMFGMGSQIEYLNMNQDMSGGDASPTVITIDPEAPENKERIDPKKYTDCFGSVPDDATTLYTVTISADLPTDGHPEIFYDWKAGTPGHAFIELSKSTPAGGVTQSFGFYPTSSYKLIALENTTLDSKLVDDGGHEYQARYTISVTAAQFQAAVNAVNAAPGLYNVGFYNCTDFALGVFNAAGGNLTIPQHTIPGFGVSDANTPQGLYEKISQLKNNGTANTTTTNNKEYAGASKGPCN